MICPKIQQKSTLTIELRSLYIPNEGTNYLLSLLASITQESKVTSTDNGVTQKVEAMRVSTMAVQFWQALAISCSLM